MKLKHADPYSVGYNIFSWITGHALLWIMKPAGHDSVQHMVIIIFCGWELYECHDSK